MPKGAVPPLWLFLRCVIVIALVAVRLLVWVGASLLLDAWWRPCGSPRPRLTTAAVPACVCGRRGTALVQEPLADIMT
jgi:hypothetical protein